jgi:hypothetical protein
MLGKELIFLVAGLLFLGNNDSERAEAARSCSGNYEI